MTQNNSGIVPIDKRVLVMPDPVSEKIGSIFIPETHKEKEEYAQTLATVIAVGETAFGEAIVEAKEQQEEAEELADQQKLLKSVSEKELNKKELNESVNDSNDRLIG